MASEIVRLDAELLGALGDISVAFVIDDTIDLNIFAVGEIFRDLLGVGAVARGKDCYFHYYSFFRESDIRIFV